MSVDLQQIEAIRSQALAQIAGAAGDARADDHRERRRSAVGAAVGVAGAHGRLVRPQAGRSTSRTRCGRRGKT